MEKFDIWDLNNEIIGRIYKEDNYECVDTGVNSEWCYILFSSNGLYYPDTKETFESQIIKKNRYEWKWVVQNSKIPKRAARIIYVRDIHKIWYSYGINQQVNSVDKTLELLKDLTKGFKVVTIGSSAGGYMAVLTAVKLHAVYCINFSGQYKIEEKIGNLYSNLCPLLKDYRGKIYYFVPAYCQGDKEQYQLIEGEKSVRCFYFADDRHASTMLTGNMPYIIGEEQERLEALYKKYSDKKINRIEFLIGTVPFWNLGRVVYRELRGFIVRKSGKHWNGV